MQKPSMIEPPSGRSPEKVPRWDLMGTEGFGSGKSVSWLPSMFSGYKSIYRQKKQVGGATRGPRGWGRAYPPGRALHPRGPFVAPSTYFFLLYISTYPPNIQEHHETLFPPLQPYVSTTSHLEAFSGTLPEGESITEGLYINLVALLMMCEQFTIDVHSQQLDGLFFLFDSQYLVLLDVLGDLFDVILFCGVFAKIR